MEETPAGFVMDVKIHWLRSHHATKPEALPPDLREDMETTDRGNVILTPDPARPVPPAANMIRLAPGAHV